MNELPTDPFVEKTYGAGPPEKPCLSVCIPTYNRAHCLGAAIESVLSQEFADFELVLVDNASTDNTERVVGSFKDSRIRYRRYEANVSMYANHNRCVNSASSDWIVFLHSDDLLPSGYLNVLSGHASCAPHAALVVNAQYGCGDGAGQIRVGDNDPLDVVVHVLVHDGYSPSGTAYRKSAFAKGGFFEPDYILADGELMICWSLNGLLTKAFLTHAQVWSKSDHSISNRMLADPEYYRTHAKLVQIAFEAPQSPIIVDKLLSIVPKLKPHAQLRLIRRCLHAGYFEVGRRLLAIAGPRRKLWGDRLYWFHVLPLVAAPRLYWGALIRWRRMKFMMRQSFLHKLQP
jgi:glycosyltransferase involved in cell wall biosynthesis